MTRPHILISIPTPCHENWGNMQANERGAFCQSCQKTVIDFSAMTDRELIEYLSKEKLSCGRFRKDQVGRTITIPRVENGFMKWRALILGLLPIFAFREASASTPIKAPTDQNPLINKSAPDTAAVVSADKISVCGRVTDTYGIAVGNLGIEVRTRLGSFNGNGAVTDSLGDFQIELTKQDLIDGTPYLEMAKDDISKRVYLSQSLKQNYNIVLGHPEESYMLGGSMISASYGMEVWDIRHPSSLIKRLQRKNAEKEQIAAGQMCVYGRVRNSDVNLANVSIRVLDADGEFYGNGAVTDSTGNYTIYISKAEHIEKEFYLELTLNGYYLRTIPLSNAAMQEHNPKLYFLSDREYSDISFVEKTRWSAWASRVKWRVNHFLKKKGYV